jgi:hypothetical protein
MIVNVTIFGNVRTDHVYITPQLHPSFFPDFFEHSTTVGLPKTTKTLTVGNHQFLWEKGKVQC